MKRYGNFGRVPLFVVHGSGLIINTEETLHEDTEDEWKDEMGWIGLHGSTRGWMDDIEQLWGRNVEGGRKAFQRTDPHC